jgi:hypothetical protein
LHPPNSAVRRVKQQKTPVHAFRSAKQTLYVVDLIGKIAKFPYAAEQRNLAADQGNKTAEQRNRSGIQGERSSLQLHLEGVRKVATE